MGIVATSLALARAQELDLDLVEVAPQADPPVCKIMDYGKWKYEQDVRAKEARRKQAHVVVKGMNFRPKISPHDYDVKKRHIRRFLTEGSKVKVAVWFRGREMAHTERGAQLLDNLAQELADVGSVEAAPRLDGKNMIMVLAPLRRQERKSGPKEEPPPGSSGG